MAITIKIFVPSGDPRRLRTAEIGNWTGKAVAAPRTELNLLVARQEVGRPGVYILTGADPATGKPMAYIGEAEVIRDRLKQHVDKDFWTQAIVIVSKDENLTKAHTRYLEGQLISEATAAGRFELLNSQVTTSRLPEADRADMESFLSRIRRLLPALGSDIVVPIVDSAGRGQEKAKRLVCSIKGLVGYGMRTSNGFVVFEGSQAVLRERPSASKRHPFVVALRRELIQSKALLRKGDHWVFGRDVEFSSPSAAAAVIHGGGANGLTVWKDRNGKTLKQLEAE